VLFVFVFADGRVGDYVRPAMRTGKRNRANEPNYIPIPGAPPIHRRGVVQRTPEQIGAKGAFVLSCQRCKVLKVRVSRSQVDAAAREAARLHMGRVEVTNGPHLFPLGPVRFVHPAHPRGHFGV
jgi:hypothetical protein